MTWEEIVFWIFIAALVHSYALFPLLLRLLSKFKKPEYNSGSKTFEPSVSVLMAAYNEENVIAEKLMTVLDSNYPTEKIQILVGSDCSTDRTDALIQGLEKRFPNLRLFPFKNRTGKIRIVNSLVQLARGDILILTDANVFFDRDTIREMVKHYSNPEIGLVDTNMLHRGVKKEGISVQEQTYIQSEVGTKNAEGRLWGCMMGPFGGCFSLRKELFRTVPENFLVDDFYINMKVLSANYKSINEKNAKVYEDISNDLREEFRRKIRIATGNYQNLFVFFPLLFRFNAISFCFFSHKVLRWIGPWLMLFSLCLNIYFILAWCSCSNQLYFYTLYSGLGLLTLPVLDLFTKSIGLNLSLLRYATHFFTMNLALFIGFIKFIGGVHTSVWEPTRRNQ